MWKNININLQNIETETSKSVLIKMPNKSQYAGYKFWHPAKLVRDGRNSYAKSIGYTDDFTFKLKKYGNGKWNKNEVISEIEISAAEFEKAFNVMDENITAPQKDTESYLIVDEPEKVEMEVKIDEQLINATETGN